MRCSLIAAAVVLLAALSEAPAEAKGKGRRPPPLTHHGGAILTGNIEVAILWYGTVPEAQKERLLSFIASLNNGPAVPAPTVWGWWKMVESYQAVLRRPVAPIRVNVVKQVDDPAASLGMVLIKDYILRLLPVATGGRPHTLVIVVAAQGISMAEMCAGKCTQHGALPVNGVPQPYVLVGDPEKECPECAWPFTQDVHRPRSIVLKPPSGNLGQDAMVMSLAGGLVEAVLNPFGDGFYGTLRGDDAENSIACKGIFGTGFGRGNPGKYLVDPVTGGAYNVHGVNNAKFLVPAIYDPTTSRCWTPL